MNEIKVGERVTIILEAVEHDTCEGCFFLRQIRIPLFIYK